MYRQTQAMLCDFLKEKNKQKSECQPFYNLIVTEANRLPEARYDSFQAEILNLLQRLKRPDPPSQPTTTQHQILTLPVRSATVTLDSKREGVVPMSRSNQGSTQGTTSSSSTGGQYYVPSPQPFGNPPSVSTSIGLGHFWI